MKISSSLSGLLFLLCLSSSAQSVPANFFGQKIPLPANYKVEYVTFSVTYNTEDSVMIVIPEKQGFVTGSYTMTWKSFESSEEMNAAKDAFFVNDNWDEYELTMSEENPRAAKVIRGIEKFNGLQTHHIYKYKTGDMITVQKKAYWGMTREKYGLITYSYWGPAFSSLETPPFLKRYILEQ